jgi:hypothetical protein
MFNFIKNMFHPPKPDPALVAAQELHDARLDLLYALKKREDWQSEVSKLQVRVQRLKIEVALDQDH